MSNAMKVRALKNTATDSQNIRTLLRTHGFTADNLTSIKNSKYIFVIPTTEGYGIRVHSDNGGRGNAYENGAVEGDIKALAQFMGGIGKHDVTDIVGADNIQRLTQAIQ